MHHEYEKFLSVVEEGSFSDAADKLHISQPALSIAVKNLEKELGAQLLYRSAGGVQLTEAGEVVYKYSKKMRKTKNNLLSELSEELKTAKTLKLGTIDSIGHLLMETQQSSTSTLEITIDNTSRLIDALKEDRLDLAFTTLPSKNSLDDLQATFLGDEEFYLVCASKLRRTVESELTSKSVISDFLSYDRNSNTYRLMKTCFSDQGIETQGSFFSTSPDLIKLMVLEGKGVALLPKTTVSAEVKNSLLVQLDAIKFFRPITSVTLKGKYFSEDMDNLVSYIREEL